MKVSIIIPIFNADKYLDACLTSVVKQTYDNIEIILVDDGSTDNSKEICEKFLNSYSDIRYIYQKNSGQASARNNGLSLATGEYISFVDADDTICTNMIENLFKVSQKHNSDVVMCGINYCYEKNIKIVLPKKTDFSYEKIVDPLMSSVCNKLYKSKILKGLVFENFKYEDLLFNVSVYFKTLKIDYVHLPLYNYNRCNENSTIATISDSIMDIFTIFEKINIFFETKQNDFNYKEIEFLYIYYLLLTKYITVKKATKTKMKKQYLNEMKTIFTKQFPFWYKNKYLKNSDFKYKIIICFFRIELLFANKKTENSK